MALRRKTMNTPNRKSRSTVWSPRSNEGVHRSGGRPPRSPSSPYGGVRHSGGRPPRSPSSPYGGVRHSGGRPPRSPSTPYGSPMYPMTSYQTPPGYHPIPGRSPSRYFDPATFVMAGSSGGGPQPRHVQRYSSPRYDSTTTLHNTYHTNVNSPRPYPEARHHLQPYTDSRQPNHLRSTLLAPAFKHSPVSNTMAPTYSPAPSAADSPPSPSSVMANVKKGKATRAVDNCPTRPSTRLSASSQAFVPSMSTVARLESPVSTTKSPFQPHGAAAAAQSVFSCTSSPGAPSLHLNGSELPKGEDLEDMMDFLMNLVDQEGNERRCF